MMWVFFSFYNWVGLHLSLSVHYWAQVMRTKARLLIILHNITKEEQRRLRLEKEKVISGTEPIRSTNDAKIVMARERVKQMHK